MNFDQYIKTHPFYVRTIKSTKLLIGGDHHVFFDGKEEVHVRLMLDKMDYTEVRVAKKEYNVLIDIIYYHYSDGKWNHFVQMGELTSSFIKNLMEFTRDYFDKRDRLRRLFQKNVR